LIDILKKLTTVTRRYQVTWHWWHSQGHGFKGRGQYNIFKNPLF